MLYILIFTLLVLISYLGIRGLRKQKKTTEYMVQQEFLNVDTSFTQYGLSKEMKDFNRDINKREINSLASFNYKTKKILIQNKIETVEDLKYSSLDFLINLNTDQVDQGKLDIFFSCKSFLKDIQNPNGRSYLDF